MTSKSSDGGPSSETLRANTLGATGTVMRADDVVAPVLTILWHPDASRVGERSRLNDPGGDGRVRLSRLFPAFGAPAGPDTTELGVKHVSRNPIWLDLTEDGRVIVEASSDATALKIDGDKVTGERVIAAGQLRQGVVLELNRRVVLLLHCIPPVDRSQDELGIVGMSPAIQEVRAQIERVAPHNVPVLVRGESGTGKELVAAAIHQLSPRSGARFVSVNMGAFVEGTASSAFFGHAKGAFTGATSDTTGHFGEADGGTLFLDEIGETPESIQPALLRALENGEVQPVGASRTVTRDVRIVAATDAKLEDAVESGAFRLPLLQRLAGYEVFLPPLRDRREDVGRLLLHFLREQLKSGGREDLLEERDSPWFPAELVTRAALAPWSGNIRELKNFVQKLVIDFAAEPKVVLGPSVDRMLPRPSPAPAIAEAAPVAQESTPRKLLRDISDDDLVEAMRAHDFRPGPAAKALGISRTSLYALIEKSDRVRLPADLSQSEIQTQLDASDGDVVKAAAVLEVSERGLQLRMKQLGMRS